MILLLGGTAEARLIAEALTEEGFEVLLSTATRIPPRGGLPAEIRLRAGELDVHGFVRLICEQGIQAVVDATHPYAATTSANAWAASRRVEIPYVAFERPSTVTDAPDIHWAADHDQAAALACSFRRPVLLTIGIRNVAPYVTAVRRNGLKLTVRILDHPSSIEACIRVGLAKEEIVCANGPFSVAENASIIARHKIGVLVTKDSGEAGGVPAKIEAARNAGCRIVVVKRPPRPEGGHSSIPALMKALRSGLTSNPEP
jgi:precorrin-6A/cobalt-precorrin-6A reductase